MYVDGCQVMKKVFPRIFLVDPITFWNFLDINFGYGLLGIISESNMPLLKCKSEDNKLFLCFLERYQTLESRNLI